MKISRSALLLPVLASLALAPLAPAQTMPSDDAATAGVAAVGEGRQLDAQAVVLRVQPAVGARYRVKQFSRSETRLPRISADYPSGTVVVITKATLDMEVTGRDALGATTLSMDYRALSVDTAGTLINSSSAAEKQTAREQNERLRADFVGRKVSLKVAPDGQLWSVVGPNVLQSALASDRLNSITSLKTLTQLAGRVNGQATEIGASAFLPAAPLRVGDGWNVNAPYFSLGAFPFAVQGKRTLKGIAGGVALVAESSALSIPPQMPAGFLAMTGTLTGNSRIDIASGLPLEINLTARASGQVIGADEDKFKGYPISTVVQDRLIIEPR